MRSTLLALLVVAAAGTAAGAESSGEKMTRSQCLQCHTLGAGEPHSAGPNLHGLIGRTAGAAQGFAYSEKFTAAMKGRVWDAALIEQWLKDTQALAPGNGMTYFQDDARKRKLIVGHLQTLK